MSDTIAPYGDQAYAALNDGFRTGEWEAFFGLLAEEVDCILPAPESGQFTGREGRQRMIAFFGRFGPGLTEFSETKVIGRTVAADRVIFEDWARGTAFGQPYAARHCIHFIIREGKVVGFHEYNRPLD